MKELSATEVARGFSDVLDAIERSGETFLVRRSGKVVAKIGPATESNGAAVKSLLEHKRVDRTWASDVAAVRRVLRTDPPAWPD